MGADGDERKHSILKVMSALADEGETMIGMFATSKAGHDRNGVYLILDETEEYVFLVDGIYRTVEKPKRKKKKHIQIINKEADPVIAGKIRRKDPITNEEIKREIKLLKMAK